MAKAKSIKEVLVAARWILQNLGWCQGYLAKNKDGVPVANFSADVSPTDSSCSFCARGAVFKVDAIDYTVRYQALGELANLLSTDTLVSFNDTPGRTKQEVLELFDRAIAVCQE